MLNIKEIQVEGYEKVIEAKNPEAGLHCFIAIHNTLLGPALGGLRIHSYPEVKEALQDVLRLSKAMTYKSALAQDGLGGGKSVIIANPHTDKNEFLLLAFGDVLNTLKGQYIAAEDVGTNTTDMVVIKRRSPYVCALPTDKSSGDPSRFTAWGVFQGILAVCKKLYGSHSLRKKKIAIQGLGSVGSKLANILFWEGADLILSDIEAKKVHDLSLLYGAESANPNDIFKIPCHIFSPCALGGVINYDTLPLLQCEAIAGGANNQLQVASHGKDLLEKNILYCPDYVINASGIINAAAEFDEGGYNPKRVRDRVNQIYDTLMHIFKEAEVQGVSTCAVADRIAEYNLLHGIGKRQKPILFTP